MTDTQGKVELKPTQEEGERERGLQGWIIGGRSGRCDLKWELTQKFLVEEVLEEETCGRVM